MGSLTLIRKPAFHAAPIASVNAFRLCILGRHGSVLEAHVIRVRVPNTMWADTFHESTIPTKMGRESTHRMVGGIVYDTRLSGTSSGIMYPREPLPGTIHVNIDGVLSCDLL
jgi:hypothetical protein